MQSIEFAQRVGPVLDEIIHQLGEKATTTDIAKAINERNIRTPKGALWKKETVRFYQDLRTQNPSVLAQLEESLRQAKKQEPTQANRRMSQSGRIEKARAEVEAHALKLAPLLRDTQYAKEKRAGLASIARNLNHQGHKTIKGKAWTHETVKNYRDLLETIDMRERAKKSVRNNAVRPPHALYHKQTENVLVHTYRTGL